MVSVKQQFKDDAERTVLLVITDHNNTAKITKSDDTYAP